MPEAALKLSSWATFNEKKSQTENTPTSMSHGDANNISFASDSISLNYHSLVNANKNHIIFPRIIEWEYCLAICIKEQEEEARRVNKYNVRQLTLRHPSQQLVMLPFYILFLPNHDINSRDLLLRHFIHFCSTFSFAYEFFSLFRFICAEKRQHHGEIQSEEKVRDRVYDRAVVALLSHWDSAKNVLNGRCATNVNC